MDKLQFLREQAKAIADDAQINWEAFEEEETLNTVHDCVAEIPKAEASLLALLEVDAHTMHAMRSLTDRLIYYYIIQEILERKRKIESIL